jgi:hypothetical protein
MTATSDSNIRTKIQHVDQGDSLVVANGGNLKIETGGIITDANGPIVHNVRQRFTIAQVNAGATLVPAIAGKAIRMVSCSAIAVGGAAAAVTTVDVLGTLAASSRKLVAFAQASLTQSAVLKDGGTGAAVLADGASYTANDAGAGVTVNITGSAVTTATNVDFNFSYSIE